MNWTPTALLVFIIVIMATVCTFGAYFDYSPTSGFLMDPPDDFWGFAWEGVTFWWEMLTFELGGLPWIFSVIWWLMNLLGLFCVIKIVWPGA